MTMNPWPRRRLSLAAVALTLLAAASTVHAQRCGGDWSEPYVCSVVVELVSGGRGKALEPGQELAIEPRGQAELQATAYDQRSRTFPSRRLALTLDLDESCAKLLAVEDLGSGGYRIKAGERTGSCSLWLLTSGNLNLDREIKVQVARPTSSGSFQPPDAAAARRNEVLARRLYLAILGREPDPAGLADALTQLSRGRRSAQVEGMLKSGEFLRRSTSLSAAQMLDAFYQGLLGRPADQGAQGYRRDVERRRYAAVLDSLLESKEFNDKLRAEAASR
jgi:hypothetical protein